MTSGKTLRDKREKSLKITAQKMSEILDLSAMYVANIELDKCPFPVDRFDDFMSAYEFMETERSEFALHLATMGRAINDQVRKYLKIEVVK